MAISRVGTPSSQRGFSYALILAAAVIVGIVAQAAQVTAWRVLQTDREAELLFRGSAYVAAIKSYHATHGAFPRSLEDLVADTRSPGARHLRMLYPDPMGTGNDAGVSGEWLLVRAADGGISGVASHSYIEPLKRTGFPAGLENFENAGSYRDWTFEFVPPPAQKIPRGGNRQSPSI